jgi:8-oxo-dGTP diphosphatase
MQEQGCFNLGFPMSNHLQATNNNRYKLIPRTLIFLFDKENVLLLKGASNKSIWANKLNGIGGHIERGENVIQSAQRELFEETNIVNQPLWICGNILINTNDLMTGILLFILKGLYTGSEFRNSEEGQLYWLNINKLPLEKLVEDLGDLLPKVYAHKISDPIFSGRYYYNEFDNLVITFQNEF